ncbi:hypothetical protein [Herbiconiux sp. L3-i23]|uniref:hypothetical protein n=1 Tax=Herbiconiux sp. L3-i23 TaxID=2905871 RepID=UPI0020454DBC|nr:hypothetical protein [Herbiconiux sp. L3-i23]BDI24054.1 hypothetical protein L3i23_28300 [Herbiconiux sp. L3-i23]
MSIERSSADHPSIVVVSVEHRDVDAAPPRRFGRWIAAATAILVVLVGALAVVNSVQGPRIRTAELNPAALVDRSGGRIVLTLSQRLSSESLDRLSIEPAVPMTATAAGNTVDVALDDTLAYGTAYTIGLPDAVGVYTANRSDLSYTFTTPDADLYTLLRDSRLGDDGLKRDDTIRRESLDASVEATVVLSAPRIEEYTTLPQHLAAVVLADDGSASVVAADADGGGAHSVLLPGVGTVRQLYGSGRSELIGFSYTGSTPDSSIENVLLLYDPRDGSGVARPVTGLDGGALQVMDWAFVPGSTSLVAQSYDGSLYLVDALSATTLSALGQHGELRGFLPGSSRLVVADPDGDAVLDLAGGETAPLEPARPAEGAGTYPGPRIYLDDERATAQLFTSPVGDTAESRFSSRIAVTDTAGTRVVYEPALPDTRIRDFCASPNGQYLAVETAPAEATLDDYPSVAAYSGMTTAIVEVATGDTVRTVYGFLPGWCR